MVSRRPVRKGFLWAALLVSLLALFPLATGAQDSEPIVVGSILDATGPINIYGTPMIDATRMAIDDINANGGVLGRQLKLVEYDGQSTNDKYTEYANQLILRD